MATAHPLSRLMKVMTYLVLPPRGLHLNPSAAFPIRFLFPTGGEDLFATVGVEDTAGAGLGEEVGALSGVIFPVLHC